MIDAPLGIAFAAGLVATVNPCGFAMLPAYLSYFLGLAGDEDDRGRPDATVARALVVGGVVSLGFIVVFGIAGLLINAGLRVVIDLIPWIALTVGVGLVVLAIAMLRGYEPTVALPKVQGGTGSRQYRSVFTFGVSYAVASLSCTLPVFLTVVVGSLTGTNFLEGLATFLAYGLGMSLVLVVLTLALAVAKQGIVRRLRSAVQYVHRASAILLLVAGVYITWYWLFNIGNDPGETTGPTRIVESWSQTATDFIGEHRAWVGLLLGSVVLATIAWLLLLRAPADEQDRTGLDPESSEEKEVPWREPSGTAS